MIEGAIHLHNQSSAILAWVRKTTSAGERMRGLLGCSPPGEGEGLIIAPCSSIHTFFMKYPIDVVFLNRENTVLTINHCLKPFRMALSPGASSVLELRAGETKRTGIKKGDRLIWVGK